MNKMKAKKKVENMLHNQFKYLFVENVIDLHTIHLTFKMDSKSYNLQMTLRFADTYCDILAFISPRVVYENNYLNILKTINVINSYAKGCGKFYVYNDYSDIVYSLRLNYSLLEMKTELFLKEIELAVQYYEDVFTLILEVASGKKSFEACNNFIHEMWGR